VATSLGGVLVANIARRGKAPPRRKITPGILNLAPFATNAAGNTSEFSRAITAAGDAGIVLTSTLAGADQYRLDVVNATAGGVVGFVYGAQPTGMRRQPHAIAGRRLPRTISVLGNAKFLVEPAVVGEQRQQNAGHLGLAQVLASPDVNFLTSPASYAFRLLGGEGTSHFMSLLGNVQFHGKLWFDENDIRTSLSGGKAGEWGRPADVAGDCLQQDKELANCLVHGAVQWWFDVGGNRSNHPVLMKRIGQLAAKADAVLSRDRRSGDEIAFVADERSLCVQRVGDPLGKLLLLGQLPALHRIGAPVGHYLASDLAQIGQRKLCFLPTSFAPSTDDRRAVEAIKRDGPVLMVLLPARRFLQASEQYVTCSQTRSHFFRHWNGRPHTGQILLGRLRFLLGRLRFLLAILCLPCFFVGVTANRVFVH
jgi:hypothetical protein